MSKSKPTKFIDWNDLEDRPESKRVKSEPTIKPIQTEYKGYLFRSRLEARWAVFLDAMSVNWEYEKEGYELESGWYLPDFWLPDLDLWLEIKPDDPSDKELQLAEELACGTCKPIAIASGLPGEDMNLYCADCDEGGGGEMWQGESLWVFNLSKNLIAIRPERAYRKDREFLSPCSYETSRGLCGGSDEYYELSNPHFYSAKRARFEHNPDNF